LAASVQKIVDLKFPDQPIEPFKESSISRSVLHSLDSFVAALVREIAAGIREEHFWTPDLWAAWRKYCAQSETSS
jgi:hypothetical protein